MPETRPLTILCVSSYEKGQEFLRTCKALGCHVLLLTVEKLRNADWPRDAVDETFFMPEDLPTQDLIHAVTYAARSQPIDRIVALDVYAVKNVYALTKHKRVRSRRLTTVRYFRDEHAMHAHASEAGLAVRVFVAILSYAASRDLLPLVPPPWLLKPPAHA